ncbi:MAG: transposase [Planctomycetota bacterium]|nr:transposase [Planctomycetota bacterium]
MPPNAMKDCGCRGDGNAVFHGKNNLLTDDAIATSHSDKRSHNVDPKDSDGRRGRRTSISPFSARRHEDLSHGPLFSTLPARRSHVRWRPHLLCLAAIPMAWDTAPSLTQRFAAVRDYLTAMFPGRRRVGRTYRGFSAAMAAVSPWLEEAVQRQLREAVAGRPLTCEGWRAFAVDGTRIDARRTIANEADFGTAGKVGCGPQMLLTTLWEMGSGLPWHWRIDRARGSEREHLRQMLDTLPEEALLVADAGFTGFDLLSTLQEAGRSFLIRVGSNVTLLRELGEVRREGRDTVYLWRADLRHRQPLKLRLIRVKARGTTMYLVTTVLDPQRLPRIAANGPAGTDVVVDRPVAAGARTGSARGERGQRVAGDAAGHAPGPGTADEAAHPAEAIGRGDQGSASPPPVKLPWRKHLQTTRPPNSSRRCMARMNRRTKPRREARARILKAPARPARRFSVEGICPRIDSSRARRLSRVCNLVKQPDNQQTGLRRTHVRPDAADERGRSEGDGPREVTARHGGAQGGDRAVAVIAAIVIAAPAPTSAPARRVAR